MTLQLNRRLTTAQAADFLGLSKATLEKDRVVGRLEIPFLKLGRRVLYDVSDLEAWMARHRRAHTSDDGSALVSRRANQRCAGRDV